MKTESCPLLTATQGTQFREDPNILRGFATIEPHTKIQPYPILVSNPGGPAKAAKDIQINNNIIEVKYPDRCRAGIFIDRGREQQCYIENVSIEGNLLQVNATHWGIHVDGSKTVTVKDNIVRLQSKIPGPNAIIVSNVAINPTIEANIVKKHN